MSNVDAAWLGMDSPDNFMMVTGVLHLDEPVDRDRLVEVLEHRLLARYPKFSQRPLPSGTPFEQPVWVDDPEFDLDRHLVEAGRLAGEKELAALVSDLLARPLDMHHSPWQFHLVELARGPDDGAPATAVVARLQPGVLANVAECTGTWCRVAIAMDGGRDAEGYIRQDKLWGVYPNERVE